MPGKRDAHPIQFRTPEESLADMGMPVGTVIQLPFTIEGVSDHGRHVLLTFDDPRNLSFPPAKWHIQLPIGIVQGVLKHDEDAEDE